MKKLILSAAIAGACLAPQAYAQQQHAGPKAYVGAELGSASLKNETGDIASALVNAVGGSVVVTQDSSVGLGRIFGGYKFTENIGAELGYTQTANANVRIAGVSGGSVAYTGTATTSYSGFDYSILLRPNESSGMNGFFLRLGGHSMTAKSDATLTGTSTATASSSKSGSGYLWGIGYDMAISKTMDLRLSYTSATQIGGISGADTGVIAIGITGKF